MSDVLMEKVAFLLDNLVSKARAAESAASTACQTANACEASIEADEALADARSLAEAELLVVFRQAADTIRGVHREMDVHIAASQKYLGEVVALTRALDALLQALPEPQRADLLKTALLAAARMP